MALEAHRWALYGVPEYDNLMSSDASNAIRTILFS